MEPTYRCGTRKAFDGLAEELNLPNEKWMQDCPYEVVIATDIEKYIDHYETLTDDNKKFVLMEGIIQATEDQTTEGLFLKYWDRIEFILKRDFNVHEFTIHYWASFDIKNIEDCWKITPLMRQLWSDNAKFKN